VEPQLATATSVAYGLELRTLARYGFFVETLSAIWRRLDVPGHDACRFERLESGWQIAGTAVFQHERAPASLAYSVTCDLGWRTQRGQVRGFVGSAAVDVTIEKGAEDAWMIDGRAGFTPATNFQQLRQLALRVGDGADLAVAWLDVPATRPFALELLAQRYERRSASTYWYEAPRFDYRAMLELTPQGTVARYPGLWEVLES
jgi:hypothetical protein